MDLVRTLGGMTLEEMLERMSSNEIVMWQAFFEIEREEAENAENQRKLVSSVKS